MSKCSELSNDIISGKYLGGSGFLKIRNVYFTLFGSTIGGIGLLYNNISMVLGSMLISPIGNPIFRSIIGILNKNKVIMLQSLVSLIIIIILMYLSGLLIGLVNSVTSYFDTPSESMEKYTQLEYINIYIIVALLSGVITSIAMYHKDFVIITGTALSISILPPIVNGGLYHAILLYNKLKNNKHFSFINKSNTPENIDINTIFNKGTNSLYLALLNILCIFLAALFSVYFICK